MCRTWKYSLYSDQLYAQKKRDEKCQKCTVLDLYPSPFLYYPNIHGHLLLTVKCTNPLLKENNLKVSRTEKETGSSKVSAPHGNRRYSVTTG